MKIGFTEEIEEMIKWVLEFPKYTQLSSRQVEEMRNALKNVQYIIIDEISMVAYEYLRIIHLRLCEIFDVDLPFGGKTLFVLGDLMQFKPINGSWIFQPPKHLSHEVNLWQLFSFHELYKNQRQTGDTQFLDLLERLRFGICTTDDLRLLESRIFDLDNEVDTQLGTRFAEAIAMFPNLESVRKYNAEKTEELRKNNPNIYKIKALDKHADGLHYDQIVLDTLIPNKER